MSLQEVHAGQPRRDQPTAGAPAVGRWPRARALVSDLAVLVVVQLLVVALATIWLVARTATGRLDIGDGDAAIAMALAGGVIPAWLAWLVLDSLEGATRGERRAGLAVRASGARGRLVRLALEPRGLLGWIWLAALLWLAEVVLVRWLALLALLAIAALAAGSGVLWLVRPGARPLHDRIVRTRLVQQ